MNSHIIRYDYQDRNVKRVTTPNAIMKQETVDSSGELTQSLDLKGDRNFSVSKVAPITPPTSPAYQQHTQKSWI